MCASSWESWPAGASSRESSDERRGGPVSELALEIAGVRVDVALSGAEPLGLSRYRPFGGATGPARWTLELRSGTARPKAVPGRSVVEREGGWIIAGAEEAGRVDPVSRAGTVSCDPGLLFLDTFLRSVVGSELIARGGLLVHGAAVMVDGGAHLFPARSGSGKSTLAARAGHPLSDEVSVLEPQPGGFLVHASPWWLSRGGSAPLVRVYALAWDGQGTTPLRRTAVRQLVTNLVLPLDTPVNRGRGLAAAAAVAGDVPFARFAFQPDSDVDGLLRRPVGGARGVE